MTDKKKITAILKAYTKKHNISASSVILEEYAEELIANGIILPPCKVGDKVYTLGYDEETTWIDEYKVKYFYCSSKGINRIYIECGTMGNNFRPKDIGKTVFLTKEEAEEKLKELNNNENRFT